MSDYSAEAQQVAEAMNAVYENKQVNKKNSITGDYSSDNESYPTVKAVKDLYGTKVTAWSSTVSDSNIASEKLVKDSLDGKVDTTDSRLTDARTPTSHTHGNISNDGKIGSTSGKPVITTTNGVLTTGSFGTASETFCQGNDSRLSDARTPLSHNQASSTITDTNTYSHIGNTSTTQESINSAINTKLGEMVDINFVTVVQSLPTASASTMGKIYLVAIEGSGTNNYAEYVTVKDGSTYTWEKFGEVSGSGLSVDWSDITSKPSTYTPASHAHGSLTNNGTLNSDVSTVNKIAVTDTSNNLKTISSLPYSKLSGTPTIPTKTSDLTNDGDGTNVFVKTNDSRLSDTRTPKSHTHGNITNDGKVGSTSGKPLITTTSGLVTTGSFGTTSGTFAEGNHTHSSYVTSSDVESEITLFAAALAEAINPSS